MAGRLAVRRDVGRTTRYRECYRISSETARLLLRPFRLRDVDDVLIYAMDPEWARYLPVPQPYTPADAEKFIAGQVLLDREVHPAWAIEHAGAVIGGINLRFHFDHHVGEMGYSIHQSQLKPLAVQ